MSTVTSTAEARPESRRREYGDDALIMCDNLVRIYQSDKIEVQALQGLDLLVTSGEMVAIVGASGSGKSTLLNVLSGLDLPTAGRARVGEWDLLSMSHADRLRYRRSVVGFVWQQTSRNLLPYLSATENVMLPMAFAGLRAKARRRRAAELLDALEMGDKAKRRPGQLSGGEQQRVAIAVALANRPQVLFADEPTGELDSVTGEDVFAALRSANRDLGATVVIVTHDAAVATQVQRTVAIRDGRTSSEVVRHTEIDEHGQSSVIAREYAVLDRSGRMQLPPDYRAALGLENRVRLELEPDHVGVWPDAPGAPRRTPNVASPQPQAAPPATAMPAMPIPVAPRPDLPPAAQTPRPAFPPVAFPPVAPPAAPPAAPAHRAPDPGPDPATDDTTGWSAP